MKTNKLFSKKNIANLILLSGYIAAHVILILHHEAWGDEAQAWIIAKNTSLSELFPALCAEGHPAGWFLLIKLVQAAGLSFYNFSFLSLLLMSVSVSLLLWKTEIPFPIKLVFLLSSLFCYFNPVICRTYSLVVLIVMLLAVLWKRRFEKPVLFGFLVAILFQTHILMAGLAGSLMFILFAHSRNNRKVLAGATASLLGFLATVLELYPRSDVIKSVNYSLSGILANLSVRSAVDSSMLFPYQLFSTAPVFLTLILSAAVIAITTALFIYKEGKLFKDSIFIAVCSFGFIFLVNATIYKITIQAATLIVLLVLFIFAISFGQSNSKFIKVLSLIFVCVLSLGTYHTWIRSARSDFLRDFSESKNMADYIAVNLEDSSIIVMKDEELARAGVYAYVSSSRPDIIFWCPDTGEEYSFYNWSTTVSGISDADAIGMAKEKYKDKPIYLLTWYESGFDLERVFAANEFCEKNDPSWLYK